MRVLDGENHLLTEGGKPQGMAKIPPRWWERVETHENLGVLVDTPEGKVFVAMLPFRLPHPPHSFGAGQSGSLSHLPNGRPPVYIVELAIPLKAVSGAFEGLRQNLIVGLIASLALLASVAVIGLCAPRYFRGQYLESELQLARRVQSDLQPKPRPVSPHVDFAATAVAADHVGGDFYDIFEAESGKIVVVLGDASGKGIPAALLVSVLQGAIRSSTASRHESACERINHMLCERTACERFATLFWGILDPITGTLRYVNAGHVAPMLVRDSRMIRLDEGGPVLGLLPGARYSAGTVELQASDTLVLYSDGISEATNQTEEEFGEDRIQQTLFDAAKATPAEICERIMKRIAAFASTGVLPDDRTLMVIRFSPSEAVLRQSEDVRVGAVA
jgi:sigma-B regulation protein RsbU (phosphoserine phosphatase)